MDFSDEPYYCLCMGQHVGLKGQFEITSRSSGGGGHLNHPEGLKQHDDNAHLDDVRDDPHRPHSSHPDDTYEYGQQHGAVQMHDGNLVLTVAMLSDGTTVQLAPGAELSHPLVVRPRRPALPPSPPPTVPDELLCAATPSLST